MACRYDTGKDGFIDLMELKLMMEKLGAPQTHLGLKNMIKEVDEDFDVLVVVSLGKTLHPLPTGGGQRARWRQCPAASPLS
uniref:EF-hand domain-containing protein n=1 Tax=Pundamilia nyererei TaxID=303518 RepID=A0A3B4EY64_9CICH